MLFWINSVSGVKEIGFSTEGLKKLGQIWHMLPKIEVGDKVALNAPIFTAEVTSGIRVLRSPTAGIVIDRPNPVWLTPEKIGPSTVILRLKDD